MSDEPVTHYVDEDFEPLCRRGHEGDEMWPFEDERITCPNCRSILAGDNQ